MPHNAVNPIQANLKSVYYKLDNDKLDVTSNPAVYKKLLYSLCFFHANVQVSPVAARTFKCSSRFKTFLGEVALVQLKESPPRPRSMCRSIGFNSDFR